MSQTTVEGVTHPAVTSGGIVTSFMPLFTPFPAVPGCSTVFNEYYNTTYAFDPVFEKTIRRSVTCLPQEVTLSVYQNPDLTSTVLGPLACPVHYTTATTSIANSLSTYVWCCPSEYTYFTNTSPYYSDWRCKSALTVGQVLTVTNYTSGVYAASTVTVTALQRSVRAFAISGLVFAPTTTSSTLSSTSAAAQTTPLGASPTSPVAPTPLPLTPSSRPLSTGAKIGIGVGVSLAVIGLLSAIFALFLYRRGKKRWSKEGTLAETTALTPELPVTETIRRKPVSAWRESSTTTVERVMSPPLGGNLADTLWEDSLSGVEGRHDEGQGQQDSVHEMSATLKVPFSGVAGAT